MNYLPMILQLCLASFMLANTAVMYMNDGPWWLLLASVIGAVWCGFAAGHSYGWRDHHTALFGRGSDEKDQSRMQEIVIDLADGRAITLWDAYERWDKDRTQFRTLCHCRNPECDGCPITDAPDLENWETER